MDSGQTFTFAALGSQFFVGLSRAMILFIVSAGLSFVLGVLRVPNVAHGSLYMIGAFAAFTITKLFSGSAGFWIALILSPLVVALVGFVAERALFCHLYQREHLMLLLFTFALSLILGDLVKIVWGAEYRSIMAPESLQGFRESVRSLFSPVQSVSSYRRTAGRRRLWLFTNKTKIRKDRQGGGSGQRHGRCGGDQCELGFCICLRVRVFLCGAGGALGGPNRDDQPWAWTTT